jgi:iron complex transport system ATP-binding protein
MLQVVLKNHRLTNGTPILSAMKCDFPVGQLSMIVGANGAGKSTLLKLLSGWEKPSAGVVSWNGKSLEEYTPIQLAKCRAYLPQDALRYVPSLTVKEIISLGCLREVAIRESLIAEAMEWMDVFKYAHRSFTELSGGEQQRVHLARCRVQIQASLELIQAGESKGKEDWQSTSWLIMDEPTQHLDVYAQKVLLQFWRDWAKEFQATVVMSMHQFDLAAQYADYVLGLKRGTIVAKGMPAEVFSPEGVIALCDAD